MAVNQESARLCLAFALVASACAATSLRGVVQDPVGAPVPGAKVSLDLPKRPEAARTSVTGATGAYIFSGLAPGYYTLTVQSPGFGVWKRAGIRMDHQADLQLSAVTLQLSPTCGSDEERPSLPSRAFSALGRFLTGRPRNIRICQ